VPTQLVFRLCLLYLVPMLGVIIIPSLFGVSASTRGRAKRLIKGGYLVEIVDIYERTPCPFFVKILSGRSEERLYKTSKLAMSFNEKEVLNLVDEKIEKLLSLGIEKMILLGLGFGSNVAFRYCELFKRDKVVALYSWSPHLIFPLLPDITSQASIKEPRLEALPSNLRTVIFHGGSDTVVLPGNLEVAMQAAKSNFGIEVVVYENARHAFDSKCIQGFWPNMLYWGSVANREAYRLSWERVESDLSAMSRNLDKSSLSR